jgi:hypothetical protein
VPLELVVQHGLCVLHARRRTHRSEGVVLVQLREAEHGHDRVPDELLDDAAVLLELGDMGRVAGHHLAEAGRASRPAVLRSENTIVTTFRNSAVGAPRRG